MRREHITTLCALYNVPPEKLMDELQINGRSFVSDGSTTLQQVADSDADRAIAHLRADELKRQGQGEMF